MGRERRIGIAVGGAATALVVCSLVAEDLIKKIPDRYVVAYAPEWFQDMAFKRDTTIPLPEVSHNSLTAIPTPIVAPTLESTIIFQSTTTETPNIPERVVSYIIPEHIDQGWNNCGPATITVELAYMGIQYPRTQSGQLDQQEAAEFLKPNPEDKQVGPDELIEYANSKGVGGEWRYNGTNETLESLISAGFTPMVEMGYAPPGRENDWTSHYLIVYGYDKTQGIFFTKDSYVDTYKQISFAELEVFWSQFNWRYLIFYYPQDQQRAQEILNIQEGLQPTAIERALVNTQQNPDSPYAWFTLGTSFIELGRYDDAVSAYEKAQQLGMYNLPDGPWRMLWYQFGPYEAYYNIGDYKKLVNLTDWVLANNEYSEEAYYWKGKALLAMGESGRAKSQFLTALEQNPKFKPAQEELDSLE